jgi:hypothetical protein
VQEEENVVGFDVLSSCGAVSTCMHLQHAQLEVKKSSDAHSIVFKA